MALFDEQLDRLQKLLQTNEAIATGTSTPSGKPKIKMTATQAQAGVRPGAAVPSAAKAGVKAGGTAATGTLQALKGVGGGVLKAATKFGGAPLGLAFILHQILSQAREGQEYLSETRAATRPPTAESMLAALDSERQRRSAVVSADQNDPEMMESLRWLLSGNERPDLTPNQVMFGGTPTTDQVPPEAIREALAAMTGEA